MKIEGKEDNFVIEWVLNQDKMHFTSICETDYQDRKKSHPLHGQAHIAHYRHVLKIEGH